MSKFEVQICNREDNDAEQRIICSSRNEAERVERGVHINLDHEHYYTEIVEMD